MSTEQATQDQVDTKQPTGCKCLESIKANLEKYHGHAVELCLKPTMIIDPEATEYEMGADIPPLYYTHREGKKQKMRHVVFNFCPFCGRPKS